MEILEIYDKLRIWPKKCPFWLEKAYFSLLLIETICIIYSSSHHNAKRALGYVLIYLKQKITFFIIFFLFLLLWEEAIWIF